MLDPILKPDCAHFHSDRPCAPHKRRGKVCASCDEYEDAARRVLLIKLAAMGDVLRTTCILRALKAKHEAPIVWLTRPESAELLAHNPWIDEVWLLDQQIWQRLENESFLATVNVDAERQSASLCAMARSKRKFGFSLDANGDVLPLNDAARHWFHMGLDDDLKRQNHRTYQQIIAAIAEVPARENELVFALSGSEQTAAAQFASRFLPRKRGAVIGFNTGGGGRWKRKQWTMAGFTEVGARILRETDHCVLLLGGAQEVEFNRHLKTALNNPRVIDANTQRSVRDFGAMISLCDVLVTGDTLGLHIGAALGKHLVALFGPTSAQEIELYGRGTKITPTVACKSYYSPQCNADVCCVDTIQVETVYRAVIEAVNQRRRLSVPLRPFRVAAQQAGQHPRQHAKNA